MRFLFLFVIVVSLVSCESKEKKLVNRNYSKVNIETIFQDSISIRAITIDENSVIYAGNNGKYGRLKFNDKFEFSLDRMSSSILNDDITVSNGEVRKPNFRAIADTEKDFFILSTESPALLYKINKQSGDEKLVYTEIHEKVFYDSMIFWNDMEGIAMGDPTDSCLSIIITRDGGESWEKISCNILPSTADGEMAFAASNGNIAVIGDKTWVVSGGGGAKSRVFYSPDKGFTWEVFDTPITRDTQSSGAFSVHFYDENNGVVFGGDYKKPEGNKANKAITTNGGKTWKLIANGSGSGYKSCIRYFPNGNGKEMVAVGFTGISVSNDYGEHWMNLSNESFYTIRFINDTLAIGAGINRISKLIFN